MASTDRPAAFWLDTPTDGPEPWSAADRDTDPAPPPISGRYAWTAPERAALPARRCRQTDPCVVPPPGSDRGGGTVDVVAAAPWVAVGRRVEGDGKR